MGGGTSGAVLASRLAEDRKKTILLIEAGRDPSGVQSIDIPLMADSVRGTEFDWQYRTMPQKSACLGHIDKVCIDIPLWLITSAKEVMFFAGFCLFVCLSVCQSVC